MVGYLVGSLCTASEFEPGAFDGQHLLICTANKAHLDSSSSTSFASLLPTDKPQM